MPDFNEALRQRSAPNPPQDGKHPEVNLLAILNEMEQTGFEDVDVAFVKQALFPAFAKLDQLRDQEWSFVVLDDSEYEDFVKTLDERKRRVGQVLGSHSLIHSWVEDPKLGHQLKVEAPERIEVPASKPAPTRRQSANKAPAVTGPDPVQTDMVLGIVRELAISPDNRDSKMSVIRFEVAQRVFGGDELKAQKLIKDLVERGDIKEVVISGEYHGSLVGHGGSSVVDPRPNLSSAEVISPDYDAEILHLIAESSEPLTARLLYSLQFPGRSLDAPEFEIFADRLFMLHKLGFLDRQAGMVDYYSANPDPQATQEAKTIVNDGSTTRYFDDMDVDILLFLGRAERGLNSTDLAHEIQEGGLSPLDYNYMKKTLKKFLLPLGLVRKDMSHDRVVYKLCNWARRDIVDRLPVFIED